MLKKLLLLLLICSLLSCSENNDKLLDKLRAAVTTGEAGNKGYKIVSMAKLTDFEWDTLYYFQELTTAKYMSEEIGFKWNGPEVPNLHHRLLFVKEGKVTSFVDYPYQEFPLVVYGCNDNRWIYPRSSTDFAAFKYCSSGDTATYTFIPVKCVENLRELMGQKCPDKAATDAK